MSEICLEKLRKEFGSNVAVDDISAVFESSTITCLLGPSGCGKTTLLRLIAGLERSTSGEIYLGDRKVNHLPPRKREISMVFQYPVVYQGLTVRQDIELPLLDMKLSKGERQQRLEQVIEMLDLGSAADKSISVLDNGTRQKVSVARAVARHPKIVLFDEPVTNVDIAAKLELQRGIKQLSRELNQTIIYVTHDQTEAMTLGDHIALMRDGQIVQYESPESVYSEPTTAFGGWFLGNPGMNFLEHDVERDNGRSIIHSPYAGQPLLIEGEDEPGRIVLGIRPEQVQIGDRESDLSVRARVERRSITIGGQILLTLDLGKAKAKAKTNQEFAVNVGDQVWVTSPLGRLMVFDENGERLDVSLAPASRSSETRTTEV